MCDTKRVTKLVPRKRCTCCSEFKSPEAFNKNPRNRDGLTSWCKQCRNSRARERRLGGQLSVKTLMQRCYFAATHFDKKKQFETCSFEQWVSMVGDQRCCYCGFPAYGLDRLDNTKGHIMGNCVPCCGECNLTRGRVWSHKEMIILGKTVRQIKLARQRQLRIGSG